MQNSWLRNIWEKKNGGSQRRGTWTVEGEENPNFVENEYQNAASDSNSEGNSFHSYIYTLQNFSSRFFDFAKYNGVRSPMQKNRFIGYNTILRGPYAIDFRVDHSKEGTLRH